MTFPNGCSHPKSTTLVGNHLVQEFYDNPPGTCPIRSCYNSRHRPVVLSNPGMGTPFGHLATPSVGFPGQRATPRSQSTVNAFQAGFQAGLQAQGNGGRNQPNGQQGSGNGHRNQPNGGRNQPNGQQGSGNGHHNQPNGGRNQPNGQQGSGHGGRNQGSWNQGSWNHGNGNHGNNSFQANLGRQAQALGLSPSQIMNHLTNRQNPGYP